MADRIGCTGNHMTEYRVVRGMCTLCDGDGAVDTIKTREYHATTGYPTENDYNLALEDCTEYGSAECPVCEGKGWIEREV